eukprot:Gregarina_sp_Poly_1__7274@NODE_39_length_18147_cov_101_572069_g34_i0_p12_GENE_NODE_39_length_18147_cov_101_572069_g34_i0NODE_39_length_18147_cov_101_572069_g34_i0_p12_ORF_typecomplete_len192_score16_77Hexapep_2/PF14602_6/0_24Hexapep_2/PF14602_6/1_3e09Hexapep/PF00132_24/5_2e02Hexapep/PF00132_24/0_6Hexapep/PF00132_24/4_7e08Mac/PF12464_8/0_0065_NODE_39_length_18147_cov_101_572069_g34_i048705445
MNKEYICCETKRSSRARKLCSAFNLTDGESAEACEILRELMPNFDSRGVILPPIQCQVGSNVYAEEGVFVNFNTVFQDAAKIQFGKRVLVGPNCSFYTVTCPVDVNQRAAGVRSMEPIIIEDDVWLGGNVTICPGVTIGAGSSIGAGSVVSTSIPSMVVAVGNPCRVIRRLDASSETRIPFTHEILGERGF